MKVFLALIDLLDYEKAARLLLEQDYFEQFIEIEKICTIQRRHAERQLLIQAMFTEALKRDQEPVAFMIALRFESVMLRSSHIIVPAILNQLVNKSGLNEMKLNALQLLQPAFHFRHANEIVSIFEV